MDNHLKNIYLRHPDKHDGADVAALIGGCPPLEPNSTYAYLLLCSHFTDTCVVASDGDGIVGAVLGYRPPAYPDTVFVWQIGVHPRARGTGLGQRMLGQLVENGGPTPIRFVEATVSPSNTASRRLFGRFAESRNATVTWSPYFDEALFGLGSHEVEELIRIGPL